MAQASQRYESSILRVRTILAGVPYATELLGSDRLQELFAPTTTSSPLETLCLIAALIEIAERSPILTPPPVIAPGASDAKSCKTASWSSEL